MLPMLEVRKGASNRCFALYASNAAVKWSTLLAQGDCGISMQTRAAKSFQTPQDSLASAVSRIKSTPLASYTSVSSKHAAVLVPLFEDANGTVRVLLTRRTASLSTHAGEVALPGGKRDETDRDDIHTALREASEELGLEDVDVLATLKPVLSKHFLSVTPVIGRISASSKLQPNPAEVDVVFDVPLNIFLEANPSVHGYVDTQYDTGKPVKYRIHYFQHGKHTIWGLTAGILIEVASLAFGRQPEFQVMPGSYRYNDILFDGEKVIVHGEEGQNFDSKSSL